MVFSLALQIQIPIVDIVLQIKGILIVCYSPACKEDLLYPSDTLIRLQEPRASYSTRPPRKLQSTTGPPTMYVMQSVAYSTLPHFGLILGIAISLVEVARPDQNPQICQNVSGRKNKASSFPLQVLLLLSLNCLLQILHLKFKSPSYMVFLFVALHTSILIKLFVTNIAFQTQKSHVYQHHIQLFFLRIWYMILHTVALFEQFFQSWVSKAMFRFEITIDSPESILRTIMNTRLLSKLTEDLKRQCSCGNLNVHLKQLNDSE